MGCEYFRVGDATVIVCSRGQRKKRCSIQGCTSHAAFECDYPLSGRKAGKTCDRSLCREHASQQSKTSTGATVDYCPTHHEMAKQGKIGV